MPQPGRRCGEELREALVRSADAHHRELPRRQPDDPRAGLAGGPTTACRDRASELDVPRPPGARQDALCPRPPGPDRGADAARTAASAKRRGRRVPTRSPGSTKAARLAADWPDPYLGLARVYAYEPARPATSSRRRSRSWRSAATPAAGARAPCSPTATACAPGALLADEARRAPGPASDEAELLREARRAPASQRHGLYDEIPGYADAADQPRRPSSAA